MSTARGQEEERARNSWVQTISRRNILHAIEYIPNYYNELSGSSNYRLKKLFLFFKKPFSVFAR